MRRKPLQVTLEVREPSAVEITVGERVQLDRLVRARHGYVAERHGGLIGAGATTLDLAPGHYHFKTLSDVSLRVVRGGVTATPDERDPKDPNPPSVVLPSGKGDERQGLSPRLTVVQPETPTLTVA